MIILTEETQWTILQKYPPNILFRESEVSFKAGRCILNYSNLNYSTIANIQIFVQGSIESQTLQYLAIPYSCQLWIPNILL